MSEMKYAKIPDVINPVSRLVFGTSMDKMGNVETAFPLLDSLYAEGINTFDTAAVYGNAESIFGEWVKERNLRDKIVIITKGAHPNSWRSRVTPYDILSDIHNSLARLKTGYIDIYLLHRDDLNVPVGPLVEVLNQLRNEGKIGVFGGSNWTHERVKEANEYAARNSLMPFTVTSPYFGLAEQVNDPWGGGCISIAGPGCSDARKWYIEQSMPVFAYSSLARGLFAGKVKSSEQEKVEALLDKPAVLGYCSADNFKRLERVEFLAEQKGYTVAQISLAWLLNQEVNTFALVSCGTVEHLRSNIAALNIKLTQNELQWLDLQTDILD